MNTIQRRLMMLAAVLLLATGVQAKERTKDEVFQSRFRMVDSTKKFTKIKFKFINNHILIPFSINGSDSMMFVLDTGVGGVMITELQDNKVLSLNYARKIKLQGLGKGKEIEAYASTQNTFRMLGIIGENIDILVAIDDLFDFTIRTGIVVNGLIGGVFLKDFIVEIDYQRGILKIWNPKFFKKSRLKRYKGYNLDLPGDKCFVNLEVEVDGKTAPMKFLIDSGLSTPLWIDTRMSNLLLPSSNSIYDYLGYGLNGDIYGRISRIPSLRLGDFTFKNIIAAFPDTVYIGSTEKLENRQGSIGADVLRRFNVILSYPDRRIYLKPNSAYKQPFKFSMSGIEVGAERSGMGYRILNVRASSPAEQVGLRMGDQIVSVNGQLVLRMKMNDLMEILDGKAKSVVQMDVIRDGAIIKVELTLKDAL